jgi:hypothetical protein
MQVTCAMLARYAELADNGSLHVFGGDIDEIGIQSDAFPATLGLPLYYAVKLAVPVGERRPNYQIRVELLKPDETILAPIESSVAAKPVPANRKANINFISLLGGLSFPEAGVYTFRLIVNGTEVTRTPLFVGLALSE